MGKKSIKKNYIYNLTYQILTILTPLLTAPYLSRVLGPSGVGTYSYIESVCSYFVLFATLGITTFGQREISYVQQDREKRSIIFWETNIIELFASLLSIIAYAIFSFIHSNWQLYIVLVFNLFAVIVNISWFFQGLEEFGKIVLRNIIFKMINIVFIFVVIKSPEDIIWYLLGTSFFTFLNNASYWISIKKYVDFPGFKKLNPSRHYKTVLSLFLPTIAMQVYTVLDKTMIGVITNSSFENGYYEQALKISRMVLTVITSLGTVMIPRIGYHFERKEKDIVKSYMYRGYRFVWFLGIPLCIGLIMVSSNFVPWFFGEGYDKVVLLIGILSFLILAIGINNVTGMQYLIPTKRQNVFTRTVVYGAVTNFILNIILIKKFQSYGAAIASVTAETVIAFVQIWIVRKELSPWEIIKSGIHYYIAGFAMAVVLYLVGVHLSSSIINTLILVVCGALTYFAVLLVIRDQFFFDNVVSIGKKIIKR
ncbi:polysaccharide biosynthesis protein [Clostridium sp. CAG:253]|nr:polysaccharide biosynthesis protein [Clostridium sp. CAG:253]